MQARETSTSNILGAWTALEALSPQTYKNPEDLADRQRQRVVDISSGRILWQSATDSAPSGCKLFYQVILGAISMKRATEELVKSFGEDEEHDLRIKEKAVIAALLLNEQGVLLQDKSIAVSSFAWALPLALNRGLNKVGLWTQLEDELIEQLNVLLQRVDLDGNPIPLDFAALQKAHYWLMHQFGLPAHLVEPPTFALRVYHSMKSKEPPEISLLNSFYLRDLVKAKALVERNAAPAGLLRYLGAAAPSKTYDLLADKNVLEGAIAPMMVPAACWPSPGGHPLILLQQAAVNIARKELAGGEGLIAVNGPPGTGKTTLLRDLVAGAVLDRASTLVKFDNPKNAFTDSGEKISYGENGVYKIFTLDENLKGHEILVASSNNKAVENVSKELPAATAMGRATEEVRYFKSVSDQLFAASDARKNDDETKSVAVKSVDTWGLCAAVLGNGKNRKAFKEAFWWHDEFAFRLYLKAAKGDVDVVRKYKHPDTGKVESRPPAVVLAEKPSTSHNATANWVKAKKQFECLKSEIDAELQELETVRRNCHKHFLLQQQLAQAEDLLGHMIARRKRASADQACCQTGAVSLRQEHEGCMAKVQAHRRMQPGFWDKLLRTKGWSAWIGTDAQLVAALEEADRMLRLAKTSVAKLTASLNASTTDVDKAEKHAVHLQGLVSESQQNIDAHRKILGERLVDQHFFSLGHERSNLTAPWIPDSLHRKREELFIAALAVHKAFIDVTAEQMWNNLGALMETFNGGIADPARQKLLGDLWSTLFMVVPVLSTTFASVERMLGDLEPGDIGWLLIDEAGQSLPQNAVGAIMRARRTVVVGDPLQIPPVTTLPERLNLEICRFFKVDPQIWSAPTASTQTLADRASNFQASFRTSNQGTRRVGLPLLVHRRCQEPMFGIANQIAYDGQMVHAPTKRDPGAIGAALGASGWFDFDGESDGKWCPAEGEMVVRLMKQIAAAGIKEPDLFIISPFKIVADKLRKRLGVEDELFATLNIDKSKWVSDRIGTIHTVQGREAHTVFLVLGAPDRAQYGARCWAAVTPNILNVAVSRAKQNLYVIGSYAAWSGVGHGRALASLPRNEVKIGRSSVQPTAQLGSTKRPQSHVVPGSVPSTHYL